MATLTLDEFLTKARPLNPEYSDSELIQAYQERYAQSPTQTVSAAPLMTLNEFLPKARKLNPEYSDDELTAAWQEKYGARGAKESNPGFSGTLAEGAKSTGRSLKAAAQTATGNLSGVEETAKVESEKDPALQKILADIQIRKNALGKDPSWWQSLKAVGGAVVDNPKGAAMLAVEQLPNSAVALGSAGAGALAGSALGPAGTVAGGIAGLFLGNTAIETGSKAIEKAGDGFTPEERAETLKEGAIKGGVVTGFDAATFGLTKWLTGTVARAMERATIQVLEREGIDTTNKAAVQAARQNPEIVAKVQQAQETARSATNTLGKKLARGAGEVGSEAIGEGAGEYIGEVAATGKGDKVEAVIEALSGLGQSGAEIAVAQGMSRKQQKQGPFGDVEDSLTVTDRTPADRLALPPPPIYGEGPVYTPTGKVEEVIPGKGRLAGLGPGNVERYEGEVMPDMGPRRLTTAPQPGEYRNGKVYGDGPVTDVSPLPDVSPVTEATTLDDAIANAVGVVRGATETAKARAAEFARMTAKAKNETDALLANAPEKRPAFNVPDIDATVPPIRPPAEHFSQEPTRNIPGIFPQPGQAESYLAGPVVTPAAIAATQNRLADVARLDQSSSKQRLAEERARMVAQREQQRLQRQANPVSEPVAQAPSVEQTDTPLPSQIDLAYPSSKQVRDLIHEKGLHLDTPVFREILKQTVGKEKFADLTPQELQTLAEKVQKIKSPQSPTQTQEAPPQVPLTPIEPKEKSYAPVTTIPEAQVPRSELTPEKNAEVLLRAEKAKADLEVAGTERGGRFFQEQAGTGSTQEVTGLKSATADWYKDLTSGPSPAIRGDRKQSAREKIETAIQKIIKDQGADRGKAVEQVKAALLQDTEFHKTEWGRDLNSILEGQWPSYMDKPEGVTQATENAKEFQKVPQGTPQVTGEVPKPVKVPKSRTQKLAKEKQKLEATKPEPSPSNAPAMETQPDTASPERAPAPSTSEAAPKTEEVKERKSPISVPAEEPFSLSAPEVSKPKAKDTGPEQLGIEIPPETIGSRPIIGREATHEEAPLFSKNAQTPDAEQTTLSEPIENTDNAPVIPKQDSGSSTQSPTEIIAEALRTAADKIEGRSAEPSKTINTIDTYQAFQRRLRDGEVTLDEYKQAFQQVKDNKEALVGELKKLTKDQLVKRSRSLRSSKNDSKDELVRQSYEGMLSTFATGRGVSYVLSGKGGYEQALDKMVAETTEDDLKKYAEDIAQATAEYKKRLEGFENPQTLQNFDDRVRIKGEASLTPEQLARYDELLAQAGRAKRKQAQEQKATVQGVEAGTDLQLIESKHTKTGEKLWVVKLANRVDRSVYDRLNQAAHKLGGRYSSYNKDGAIPGFTFRSEEAAKSFMAAGKGETVSAAPVREAATIQVQNNAVAKLREMADNLEGKADDSLNSDRKTNTAKRARQASSAENDALKDKALAETMRNLADAIESGEATHLSGLRTKAQVEMLDSMLERAKYDRIKQETKGSYVDYERQKHRKAEPEDAAFASYPELDGSKSELFSAYKDLATIKGADRLRNRFYKQAESLGEGQRVKLSREDVELAIEKYPRKSGIPWHWPETLAKLKRLEALGITSLPELRAALREFVEYRGKRGTIDKAKQLERSLIGNKGIGNDFFPTPKATAQRMVDEAGIEPGMKVLEPSAGNGNIAEAIRAAGVNPDVVEQSSNLREILEAKGFNLAGQDFLEVKDGGYDRIIMNPPFSNGQDAEHIHHAYTLLNPGGKLVAIAGEGIFFRNDAKATAFRTWLDDVGGTSEKLPEGTFKDASLMATTGVNARMVVIEKPTEESAKPDSFLSFLMDERGSIPASFFGRRDATQETGTIDPPTAKERLNAAPDKLRPYLLGALGLEQLSQVYGKDHAEVKAYNKATQDMEADFTEMSRDSDKVARAWTALKIPVADKMAQVMEDARFLNFDPDPSPVDSTGEKRSVQEADSPKKTALRERFEQLPGDAQAVYRQARDFYTNMAEQRFQALKERIERAGGTPENTRKLVDRLQLAYEQVRSKVYFPFTRFGENIVIAKQMKDGKEADREVHAFESVAEAQKFATMMKLKGWTVKQTVAREYSVDKEGPASKIVRQMHDIIKELGQGQQGLPGVMDLENQLLDSLNQSFLQALPDMSYAKHFIHAKDVKGASRDALRSFAHSALHGAHHISRIRHADKVTQALMGLDEKINETTEGDTTEARQVYNELVKRHNDIMNPNTHPVSAWLGQLGFTMSLGGVVATGITNATQVPLVTYPWLGARYGFGKASAALARAYKDFLNPRTLNKDSLFDATKSKLISESERKMLLELARRGHIDLTQTMDLAGLSSRDNLSRKARTLGTVGEKVTRMLGFTFHVPEVMNRQVTALSTFRLEKEKGGSFEDALEKAQQAIQDTHFIYQSFNRPRYMQGNFLRVLTMFKQYSQNIAYTYGRAASIWLDRNNATKEERQIAKRQLASMLALQFGAAGALGMPFFGTPISLIMHALGAMDDDDEEKDWEVALRQWLDGKATSLAEAFLDDREKAREVGKELAEVVSHGASRLTPWDMAGRLGQNDLFLREPQREREGRQAVMDWMMALGGPVPSYWVNFLLGMGDVAKGMTELNAGFFLRGVEELTPAVLRNGVKSLRYTLEGVRTRDEYKQLDLSTSEQLGQAFGFTPARVAEMYESTTAVKNKEHRILNQQKALKDRFARAVDDQDDQAKQNILDDIRGFNERNPIFAITSNTLNRSIKTRRQHEAGMERGMYLPPRRRALMDDGDFGDF